MFAVVDFISFVHLLIPYSQKYSFDSPCYNWYWWNCLSVRCFLGEVNDFLRELLVSILQLPSTNQITTYRFFASVPKEISLTLFGLDAFFKAFLFVLNFVDEKHSALRHGARNILSRFFKQPLLCSPPSYFGIYESYQLQSARVDRYAL